MKLLIWNVGTEEIFVEIELPELCISASFNSDGSKLATTCKDKQIRVFNARTGEMLSVSIIWALMRENLSLGFANNKGTDQPVHLCRLISAFVIRF